MNMPTLENQLPYVTADLPGIGGLLRLSADDFVVEEIPLYAALGEGTHLYVNLTKVGLTTREVEQQLERLFGLGRGTVGYAGLKDKDARTTQTFSIPLARVSVGVEDATALRIAEALPVTVNWARLHRNKLKIGHLVGNRFQIRIGEITLSPEEAEARARAIVARLVRDGLPNYFGPQRFGGQGDNAEAGLDVLTRKRFVRDRWLRKFLVSSYQSQLCNRVLALRVERGSFLRLLPGDIAKKHETGGIFEVEDLSAEQPRFDAHEISFTAPMFGSKMRRPQAEAAALEAEVEAETGITETMWRDAHTEGTRRMGRLLVPDLALTEVPGEGSKRLGVTFTLPKGGFATTVLRELMKSDTGAAPVEEMDIE